MDDNNLAIFIMNIVVMVLFAFTLAFVIYTYKANLNNLKKQREDINNVILYIRYFDNLLVEMLILIQQNVDDMNQVKEKALKLKNLMDLDEFRNISPDLKAKYKKYIVDQLMTSFASVVNKQSNNKAYNDAELQSVVNYLISTINGSA